MTIAVVNVPDSFIRALKKLPPHRAKAATKALKRFMENREHPSLRYRKLHDKPEYWIINVNRGDRIILRKEDELTFSAVDIGPHDNVYRRWNR